MSIEVVEEVWIDEKLYCDGGELNIWSDGTREWLKNGKLHRDGDEPAIIYPSGTREWYRDGKRHRD